MNRVMPIKTKPHQAPVAAGNGQADVSAATRDHTTPLSHAAAAVRIVHSIRGRVRLHLPGWCTSASEELEARLRAHPGVRRVQANPLTRNVLIFFDPNAVDAERVRNAVSTLTAEGAMERERADGAPDGLNPLEKSRPKRKCYLPEARRKPHGPPIRIQYLKLYPQLSPAMKPLPSSSCCPPPHHPAVHFANSVVHSLQGIQGMVSRLLGPRGLALLPPALKLVALAVSIFSSSSPWGMVVAGAESLQVLGEMHALWVG